MGKLNEKSWDAFELDSMFTFERGKEKNMASLIQGCIPLVSARKINNGIKGFMDNPKKVVKGGNVISLNNDGDGGAGLAYYQPADFALDTHVTALYPKKDVLSNILIYMTASISKQHAIFGHGRSISLPRAHRIQVMLPVNDLGKPDYDYMAQYTSEMRRGMLTRYRTYVASQLSQLEYKQISALDEKEWKEFRLGKLFEISRPKARNKDHYEMGDIPFVASGATNNGVMKCCKPHMDEQLDAGNCITVSPVDGSSFYQPIDFLGRGGAGSSILMLRNNNLNLFRGEFMARMVQQTCSKYSYGHMGNKDSIKRERIMLPVNAAGEPDYEYMEQYAKNMMLKKYRQYLEYLEGQH